MRSTLSFGERTATALVCAFEEATSAFVDDPGAPHAELALLEDDLDDAVREVLLAPGRLTRLDGHVDLLIASAHRHLPPAAAAHFVPLRANLDCDTCAGPRRRPCTASNPNPVLLDNARCADLLQRMVTDILAFVRADYGDLITDADLDLDLCLSAADDDQLGSPGIAVRHAWSRPRLTILLRHDPSSSRAFSSLAVRAMPFLLFDAVVSRALHRVRDEVATPDPFRDGWLAAVALRICARWSTRSTAFPASLLVRCAERGADLLHDRARRDPIVARGEDGALHLQSLLRDVVGARAPSEMLEVSKRLALAGYSRLTTNELIWLVREAAQSERLRNQIVSDLGKYLHSRDLPGAIERMIDLIESFA